jgi:hypothetical protein
MLCLSYYAYVFSSTKLEIRAKQGVVRGVGGEKMEAGDRGRNDPHNVCTCE